MKGQVFVIRDSEGNYPSPNRAFTLTDEGWCYVCCTGDTTGFTFYTNKNTLAEDLAKLQHLNEKYGFEKHFIMDEIDLATVPAGQRVITDIAWCIQDENGQYVHRDSIKKVGNEYFYLPHQNLSDGCRVYTKRNRVEEAHKNLNLHNQCGCLGHEFTIVPVEM